MLLSWKAALPSGDGKTIFQSQLLSQEGGGGGNMEK